MTRTDAEKANLAKFELDHATDNGIRHFIVHGPLPKGLSDKWGYPICDSMNRHHVEQSDRL